MKYNTQWLIDQTQQPDRIKYLFFWGHQPTPNGQVSNSCFSQWWAGHPFTEDGISYPTAEHYMMAEKARLFGDTEILAQILASDSPGAAKQLGREVKNFDIDEWKAQRCAIVVRGNYLKFSQHPALASFLLKTKHRVLVEASPRDTIWGIGWGAQDEKAAQPSQWRGLNLLGFCLMEVRDLLAKAK